MTTALAWALAAARREGGEEEEEEGEELWPDPLAWAVGLVLAS